MGRVLEKDPNKRIKLGEMKRELWWWKNRKYIESCRRKEDEEKVDDEVVLEMVKIGYDEKEVR